MDLLICSETVQTNAVLNPFGAYHGMLKGVNHSIHTANNLCLMIQKINSCKDTADIFNFDLLIFSVRA